MKKIFTNLLKPLMLVTVLATVSSVNPSLAQSPYCNANTTNNTCAYPMSIGTLTVKLAGNTIYTNNSGCVYPYQLYGSTSSPAFTLMGNSPYTIEFTQSPSGPYALHIGMWIDLNGDNDYDDAYEYVAGTSGASFTWSDLTTGMSVQTRSFTMPAVSSTVTTRVRFRTDYTGSTAFSNYTFACSTLQYGETEEYVITLQPPPANDLVVQGMTPNANTFYCGSTPENISVNVFNLGSSAQSNFTVGAVVTGTLNGSPYNNTFTTTYSGTLSSTGVVSVNVGSINTTNGANLTIKGFVALASDANRTNDSVFTNYAPTPQPPDPSPVQTSYSRCGNGTFTLGANSVAGFTDFWYDAASGGNLLATGSTYTTPVQSSNKTYYLGRAKVGTKGYAGPGLKAQISIGTGGGIGYFFDITPTTSNISLDSIYWYKNVAGSADLYVFMRTGTYAGNERTTAGWTQLSYTPGYSIVSYASTAAPVPNQMPFPNQVLQVGQTYGFFIFSTQTQCLFHNAEGTIAYDGLNYKDGELYYGVGQPLVSGAALFVYNGLPCAGDIKIVYRKICVNANRAAVQTVVKRTPTGSSVSKGTPYKGTYRSGTLTNFDYTAAGDTVTYELIPPTGFSNSGFGTTWTISNLLVRSVKGATVPASSYSVVNPSASGNGKLIFIPTSGWTDSLIRFDVTVKDLNAINLCDSTISRHIFIAPRPTAGFVKGDVCLGERVSFTNTSTLSSGTSTYFWEFGDGTTSTFTHPEYKYSTFGTYQVKLTVTSNYGYVSTSTQTVQVFEIPSISFKSTNACEGDSVTFSNSTTISTGTITYNWDFGDGGSSTSANTTVRHQYATPGEYFVKLTATANGCGSEATRRAYQFPRPVPDFTSVTECNSKESEFKSTSTIFAGSIGHVWDFGDGQRSTLADPMHIYQTYGSKAVKLRVVSEFGCADSITRNVSLNESPKADFTTSPVCTNDATVFTNTSQEPVTGVTIYKWYFGTGDSSSLVSPSYLYPGKGNYKATLIASNSNGCWDQKEVDVKVLVQPTADFEAKAVCAGEPMKFNNKSNVEIGTDLTYMWKFDDGNSSTTISPSHTYNTSVTTTYNVTLYSQAVGGCADSVTKQVKVNAIPNCNFTITNTGNRNYVFTPATTSGVTYQWLFGTGASSTSTNPSYHYDAWGDYDVTLVLTSIDGGCQCSRQVSFSASTGVSNVISDNGITVYPNPNTGQFSLKLDGMNNVKAIGIYNVLGEQVGTVDVNSGSNNVYSVNLDNVSNGVYFVKVMAGDQLVTKKFTVSR